MLTEKWTNNFIGVIMFEKEAEEYAIENYETCLYDDLPYTNDSKAIEKAFENGAEFGYNKAFVEADKNLKAILADFKKANEKKMIKKMRSRIAELEEEKAELKKLNASLVNKR